MRTIFSRSLYASLTLFFIFLFVFHALLHSSFSLSTCILFSIFIIFWINTEIIMGTYSSNANYPKKKTEKIWYIYNNSSFKIDSFLSLSFSIFFLQLFLFFSFCFLFCFLVSILSSSFIVSLFYWIISVRNRFLSSFWLFSFIFSFSSNLYMKATNTPWS